MTRASYRLLRVGLVLCMAGAVVPPALAQETDVLARAEALRNAGEFDRAVDLLRAEHERVPTDHRVELMLGETLYWQGDFTRAAGHFQNVLRADPANASARRQLLEIKAASAPWVRLRGQRDDDTQPVARNTGELDVGFFMNPLWSLGVRGSMQRATSRAVELEQIDGRAEIRGYLPRARIDVEVEGGVATTLSNAGLFANGRVGSPVGRAELGRRFGRGLRLAGSIDRDIYTATVRSLAVPIEFTRPRLLLRLDRRNWLGEAAVQQEIFPDDNRILTTYAWLLAPVLTGSSTLVQAGYAFSYQDSDESRFNTAGVYEPYFTPENQLQHSLAGSFVAWHSGGARFQVNGSYTVYGLRGIPVGSNPPQGPGLGRPSSVASESFHPYNVRAAATLPLGASHAITVEAERMKTAFYYNTRLAALISFRFAPRPAT